MFIWYINYSYKQITKKHPPSYNTGNGAAICVTSLLNPPKKKQLASFLEGNSNP